MVTEHRSTVWLKRNFGTVALAFSLSALGLASLGGSLRGEHPPPPPPGGDKCELNGHPEVGPCDPDKGYIWDGECYHDDGCYSQIEECC